MNVRSRHQDAVEQLCGLGFDKAVVVQMLKEHNNDIDKAAEALVKMQSTDPITLFPLSFVSATHLLYRLGRTK